MSKVASKVMRILRGMALTMGVAVMLALTVGLASTALAGTGVGARFHLGQTNTVDAISKLVGGVAGPSLLIDNNSTNATATALDLQVEAGKPPMKVNSATKVANLNSDKLDGKDSSAFVGSTYINYAISYGNLYGDQRFIDVFCDGDDFAVSGSYGSVDAGTVISGSLPYTSGNRLAGWTVLWKNDATMDALSVIVVCADVGTPHQ
jgi:hypothetical protein